MTKENKKLKPYQILILGCLLSPLIILNSNFLNVQRATNKVNIEKKNLFDKIILNRKLEGEGDGEEEEPLTGSNKVCNKGSEELRDYYKTGDLTKIGLNDDTIKCEEKGQAYFDALINIITKYVGEDSEEATPGSGGETPGSGEGTPEGGEDTGEGTPGAGGDAPGTGGDAPGTGGDAPGTGGDASGTGGGTPGTGGDAPGTGGDASGTGGDASGTGGDASGTGGRRLNRKLDVSINDMQDDLIAYVQHIIPIVAFLVIAILSIPGWLICCFCCCCNCCCCCCCKKPGCKIPCFIFTYIFYSLAVVICIYGLSQTNKAFVGLANTECSILKFFDQVLDGEKKEEPPRWAGITGINDILDGLYREIDDMDTETKDALQNGINAINTQKEDFIGLMNSSAEFFRNPEDKTKYDSNYLTGIYHKQFDNYNAEGQYVLDLVNMFGRFDENKEKFIPANSTLDAWEFEYKTVAGIADEYIDNAKKGFDEIISGNKGELLKSLDQGKSTLEELRSSFDDIKSQIADPIIDYSDLIDDYGKLGSKLVFGVLALMNVALAVLVLLICFCSGKMCTNCCCCRCICKFFTHLLWNILALLMIVTFLVGFIFSLVGTIGNDVMNVIKFVVSEENIGQGGKGILINKLGDAKKYLNTCINGEGNIEKDLGLSLEQIDSFDLVNEAEEKINYAKGEFESKKEIRVTYNAFSSLMTKRGDLSDEAIFLIPEGKDFNNGDKSDFLPFLGVLTEMNIEIQKLDNTDPHKKESWAVRDFGSNTCGENDATSYAENVVFSPQKCKPYDRLWISSSDNDEIKVRAQIISDTVDQIFKVKNIYQTQLDELNLKYTDYLNAYIGALDTFKTTISKITSKLREFIGDGKSLFGFINGKFIGSNLKIILKYLKSALGNDIQTSGICLLIVGCSLALSISSTILLIVVINTDIDNNKLIQNNQIPEYKLNSGGRVIQYQ